MSYRDLMMKPQYPKFRFSNIFNQVLIGINDPEYYKQIIIQHDKFSKWNSISYEGLISKGIVLQEGEKWHKQRKLLSNSFTYENLIERLQMMNQVVDDYIYQINSDNIIEILSNITGDIVSKSFFCNTDTKLLKRIPQIIQQLGQMKFKNPLFLLKNALFGMKAWNIYPSKQEVEIDTYIKLIKQQLNKLIIERLEENKTNHKQESKDFLDIHLQQFMMQDNNDPNKIEIDEIIQQFITLYFAGTDTTAFSSANILYLLGQNQEQQEEVYQEIVQVFKEASINRNHLSQLVKLQAFISESLRLRPPNSTLILRYAKQDVQIKDLKIKKGQYVLIDNFVTRTSDQYIDRPLEFDYKRWLNRQNPYKTDTNYENLSFSAGARNCIGQHMARMEMIIILSKILRRYKIELSAQPRWEIKLIYQFNPINVIKFIPRKID
ncbi:hypothetical protein pb186bvf_000309 [Paramecium bursaria]